MFATEVAFMCKKKECVVYVFMCSCVHVFMSSCGSLSVVVVNVNLVTLSHNRNRKTCPATYHIAAQSHLADLQGGTERYYSMPAGGTALDNRHSL